MEQHLGRQLGVQKVQVSLIDGKVEITPKPDGRIDPIQVLKATYDSGVSVAEMSIIATGQMIKNDSGQVVFHVPPSQSFVIIENEISRQLENLPHESAGVTIRGLIYQKQKGQKKQALPTSLTLTIQEIQQKE